MTNWVHKGISLTVIAPYNLTVGQGVQVGNIFGFATNTVLSGANTQIDVTGVYDAAKDTSTFNPGDLVYWNNATQLVTAVTEGNLLIGAAELQNADGSVAPGGLSGDPTVRVRLNASFAGSGSYSLPVNLTAAQLIAMEAAPITVIPAPGAGMAILVDSVLFEMTPGTVEFTGGGAVELVYHGGSTVVHAGSVPASVVTSGTQTQSLTELGPPVATNGTTVPVNTGVDITNATTPFAAGNGVAKLQIRYRIVAP